MQKHKWIAGSAAAAALAGAAALPILAKDLGYSDTPMLPGGKWHVHDGSRPQPPIVTPGTFSTQDTPGKPPSDATVLFDGADLSRWQSRDGKPCGWKVENGYMEVPPRKAPGGGDAVTKEAFGDCQLHLEWSEPNPPHGDSQGRGNSGVFFMGRYELQVLDSYHNPTYPDGQTGSIYGQYPPQVNASRPPGEWQVYDVVFTAPRFTGEKLDTPAYITVFHNGVVVQNHTALLGATGHRVLAKYRPHGLKAPLGLQDHGDPVRFRNIWIRELKPID